MYTVWHVDKYKITFKLVINWTNEILQHIVVSSGLSRPGVIDARARYGAAFRRLRNTLLEHLYLPLHHPLLPLEPKTYIFIFQCDLLNLEPGQFIRYGDWIPPGRSGDRIQMGPSFSYPSKPTLGAPPSFICSGTQQYRRVKRYGHAVDHPSLYMAPRLKKEKSCTSAICLCFIAVYKVNFNIFTFYLLNLSRILERI